MRLSCLPFLGACFGLSHASAGVLDIKRVIGPQQLGSDDVVIECRECNPFYPGVGPP